MPSEPQVTVRTTEAGRVTCCSCDHDCACGDGCCYCGECET